MQADTVIEDFMRWHRRAHEPSTVKYYHKGLRWFVVPFGLRDWIALERTVVMEALDAANRRPSGEPWSSATITRNNRALEQLQKHARETFDLDPILRPRDFLMPAAAERDAIPTEAELAEFCERAGSPQTRAAFRALAQSGMRPSELCRAKIADLSPAGDLITLQKHKTRSKTRAAKRIPLGETMQELVATAIGSRTAGPIWLNDRGTAWTADSLSKRFRTIRDRANCNPELVLYSLRHYKGTEVARRDGILAVQKVLGHSRIATSQRYSHLTDQDTRHYQDGGNRT